MKAKKKQKTWSGVEWNGFQYTGYTLSSTVLEYKFKTLESSTESEVKLLDILKRFREEPFERAEARMDGLAVFKDTDQRIGFTGTPFAADLLAFMLNLQKDGIDPFAARWFYYDTVYCLQDAMNGYVFFVAHEDKVVNERVRLVDHSGSGFDPHLFDTDDEYGPIWSDERDSEEAINAHWYKKFYTETKTGQLYMLSPAQRPYKSESEIATANVAAMFTAMNKQLAWIILLLVVIGVLVWFRR